MKFRSIAFGLAFVAVGSLGLHNAHTDIHHFQSHDCALCQTIPTAVLSAPSQGKPVFSQISAVVEFSPFFVQNRIDLSSASRAPPAAFPA